MSDESKQTNPWQTHASDVKYENPWMRVVENQVTNPGGGPGIYGVVHFQNRAVGVIPVDEEDHTWLVGQYRYAQNSYEWEIPEGGCPMDEDLLESAKRELLEEAGIEAQEYELIIDGMQTSNSICDERAWVYVARGLTYQPPQPEQTEELALKRVSLDEAFAMVDRGEIRCSLAMVGLLKLRLIRELGS